MPCSLIARLSVASAAIILAAWPSHAGAQAATALSIDAPRTLLKGDRLTVRARVTFSGDCPSTPAPTGGTVTLHAGPLGEYTYPLGAGYLRTCSSGSYTDATDFYPGITTPGDYTFTAGYSGTPGYAPAASAPATVTVVPYLSGPFASATAKLSLAPRAPTTSRAQRTRRPSMPRSPPMRWQA